MNIGVVERKLLRSRSDDRCAYPGCTQRLTINLDDPRSIVLGDAGAVRGGGSHPFGDQRGTEV